MVLFKYTHLYSKKATNQKKSKIGFTLRNSKIKTEIIFSSTITHIYRLRQYRLPIYCYRHSTIKHAGIINQESVIYVIGFEPSLTYFQFKP